MSVQSKQTSIPDLPKYHKFDDDFINDPNSMKFQFTSVEDVLWNNVDISIDGWTGNQPVSHSKKKTRSMRVQYQNSTNNTRERPIPKTKKKKYKTKPKNHSKIAKMKDSKDKFGLN